MIRNLWNYPVHRNPDTSLVPSRFYWPALPISPFYADYFGGFICNRKASTESVFQTNSSQGCSIFRSSFPSYSNIELQDRKKVSFRNSNKFRVSPRNFIDAVKLVNDVQTRHIILIFKGTNSEDDLILEEEIEKKVSELGDIRVILAFEDKYLLSYYDIRDSVEVFNALSLEFFTKLGLEISYVEILESDIFFCNENYNGNDIIDIDLCGSPENLGTIKVRAKSLTKEDTTIKLLLNVFGTLFHLKWVEDGDMLGYYAEYCDIRSSQSAYESLNGCEYENSLIEVSFFNNSTNIIGSATNMGQNFEKATDYKDKIPSKESVNNRFADESEAENTNHAQDSLKMSKMITKISHNSNQAQSKVSLRDGQMTKKNIPIPPAPKLFSAEKKQNILLGNELNVNNIKNGLDRRTTFMIRNIPNKYTQCMLISFLNHTHKGLYDFLYLRMDFKNKCNVGYAFINFCNTDAILSFIDRMMGKKWAIFNSDKVCTLSYANVQGKKALINRFRNSSIMLKDLSYRPKIFYTIGVCAGEEAPFPGPSLIVKKRVENFANLKKNDNQNKNNYTDEKGR